MFIRTTAWLLFCVGFRKIYGLPLLHCVTGPLDGGYIPEGLLGQCRCWEIGRSSQAEGICLTLLLGWKNVGCGVTWPSWQHCLTPQQSVTACGGAWADNSSLECSGSLLNAICSCSTLPLCLGVNTVSEMQRDRNGVCILCIYVEKQKSVFVEKKRKVKSTWSKIVTC